MPNSITFTRTGTSGMQLSRAHAQGWAVEVWSDESPRSIALHRHCIEGSTHASFYMTAEQARALAHELLHAADVAQTQSPTSMCNISWGSWRIGFQSDEAAARAAFDRIEELTEMLRREVQHSAELRKQMATAAAQQAQVKGEST